jgi:hypothetical protein
MSELHDGLPLDDPASAPHEVKAALCTEPSFIVARLRAR